MKYRNFKTNYNSSKTIKCHFCGKNHKCRNCPIEKKISPILRKKVGITMENVIGNSFKCPFPCGGKLQVIGTHSPSRDLVCKKCNKFIEVKSKCLSVKKLPKDIYLNHGNYDKYIDRGKDGLDFIVIIYEVDRRDKKITIRKVLYIDDKTRKNRDVFEVSRRRDKNSNKSHSSDLSTIKIKNKDHSSIKVWNIDNNNKILYFRRLVDELIETYENDNAII